MIVKQPDRIEEVPITSEGFEGFTARYLFSKDDGCERYAMRLMEIQPGGHTSVHSHPEEHEFYFLDGQPAMVDGNGRETRLNAGDAVYTAPDEVHQIKNVGDKTMRLICTIPILPGGDGKSSIAKY